MIEQCASRVHFLINHKTKTASLVIVYCVLLPSVLLILLKNFSKCLLVYSRQSFYCMQQVVDYIRCSREASNGINELIKSFYANNLIVLTNIIHKLYLCQRVICVCLTRNILLNFTVDSLLLIKIMLLVTQ